MNPPPSPILLVEDNEDDVFIFQRVFRRAGLRDAVRIARDGEEALDYLAGRGAFAERNAHPLPYLVLLDLKLPRLSGLDVLEWISRRDDLRRIPVIILTSSAEHRDLERTRALGALHYLVKPPPAGALLELVEMHRSGFGTVAATDGARPEGDKYAQRCAV